MSPLYAALYYIALILGTIPLLILIFSKNKLDTNSKSIFPYLVVVFVASFYEYFGTYLLKISSVYWFMTYKILAIITLQYFFYHILNKKYKILFLAFTIIFTGTFIYNLPDISDETYLDINGYLNAIITVIVFTFSILWFKQFNWNSTNFNFNQNPNLYFIIGLLLIYSGTLFLHLFANTIYLNNKQDFFKSWILNFVLNIINRTCLIVGVWKSLQLNKIK